MALAGSERRVGELDRDGAGAVDREVPAGGVAQVGFAVAVLAGGDGADPGVHAVRVGEQQQALPQHRSGERLAGPDGRELAEHPGPQCGFGDHVDQRDLAPAVADRFLQAPQVPRFGLRAEGCELQAPLLRLVIRSQSRSGSASFSAASWRRISSLSVAVNAAGSSGLWSLS